LRDKIQRRLALPRKIARFEALASSFDAATESNERIENILTSVSRYPSVQNNCFLGPEFVDSLLTLFETGPEGPEIRRLTGREEKL